MNHPIRHPDLVIHILRFSFKDFIIQIKLFLVNVVMLLVPTVSAIGIVFVSSGMQRRAEVTCL